MPHPAVPIALILRTLHNSADLIPHVPAQSRLTSCRVRVPTLLLGNALATAGSVVLIATTVAVAMRTNAPDPRKGAAFSEWPTTRKEPPPWL
jgi:hypothetical protein